MRICQLRDGSWALCSCLFQGSTLFLPTSLEGMAALLCCPQSLGVEEADPVMSHEDTVQTGDDDAPLKTGGLGLGDAR